jgi:hypothetical protein
MRRFNRLAASAVCALLLAATAFGQSERGTISGAIQDASGAMVPGAKVTITNIATNVGTAIQTNETGGYVAPNLPPGDYSVRVEKEGFRSALITQLTLNAASSVRADITLEIGQATQTVEVTADAVRLQTDNAKSATTITQKLVDDLPTVVGGAMRSPFDLAILTPESKNFGDNNFQMGGGQAASFGVNLDGVSAATTRALSNSWVAVNTPSLDAITEFTVETNGYKAEYGHAGGGQMTFSSKSGTNQIHGTAYEFLRNEKFDANQWFSNANRVPRQIYKQHDFGATVGGPVWIPKVYNGRDKTFFFFSWEAFRNRVGASSAFQTVPTPEMYDGDFRNWIDKDLAAGGKMIQIYNPFALRTEGGAQVRDPFPNNQIPKTLFDPLGQKALAAFQNGGGVLKPNVGASPGQLAYVRNNYLITSGTEISPQNKYSLKGDHSLGSKDRFSGYIGWNRTSALPGPNGPRTLPGNYSNYNDLQRNSDVYRFSWDRTIRPNLLNRFYAGGNNWQENHDPIQATVKSGINWKDKVCLPNVPDCDQNLVNLRFSEYSDWGGPANNGSENDIMAFNDDLTWIKGRHTFKVGGMYQHAWYNGFGRQDVAGRANFSFIGTGVPGNTNFTTAGGNSFASFLLGWATDGGIDTVRYIAQEWPYFAGYFQDDWRVSSKLTLNLGLRWETTLPPYEANDRWSDFDPTRPNPGAGGLLGSLIYAGSGAGREGTRTLADSWFGGWGPRLGMAYSVNDKTVIRGNFARSFSAVTTTTGSTHQKGFTQTVGFGTVASGVSPTFLFKEGVPNYPVPPFIDPTFQNGSDMPWWQGREVSRLPEQLTWNLSIQRQLSNSMVLDVGYNALIGTHLQAGLVNINQVPFSALSQYGSTILNSAVDSPAAIAAGIRQPWPGFADFYRNVRKTTPTVAQALRPYPQYTTINTWDGNGDHSGHSNYHALVVKFDKRFARGMTFTSSYVFSKLLTDADTYWITDNPRAADQYNRRLEKSIGSYDVTHNLKFAGVFDLPFGKGRRWAQSGVANALAGGWRFSLIALYSGGRPVGLSTSVGTPLFAGRGVPVVPTDDNWGGTWKGDKFDPNVDKFFQPASYFGAQPTVGIGNATRLNPKMREFGNFNENISVAKIFPIHGERVNVELRGEGFNVLNRVRFGVGNTNVTSPNFGLVTGTSNGPRRFQLGAKLRF